MRNKVLLTACERFEVYQDGDKLVKVYNEDQPKSVAMYDALTHARVEETGLKVPCVHEITKIDGRWAVVLDYIEGNSLDELLQQNPENFDEYLEIFVDTQIEIHSKQAPLLSMLKDKISKQIKSLSDINEVEKYDLLTRLESMPKHRKLCHCSFTTKNVLLNDNGIYVVDWSSAKQGNASADVGITYLRMCKEYNHLADKYLDLFCNKTKTPKKYVQDWLPLVAASQLSIDSSVDKEFFMKWIDVVDYE